MKQTVVLPSGIRFVNPEDCGVLVTMIKALAAYEKLSHLVVASERDLHQALFVEKRVHALIAEHAGVPIGYAFYYEGFSTFLGRPYLVLEDLYVDPANRRQGYGERFFEALKCIADDAGYRRIEWRCLDWNTAAMDFYQSLGATVVKDWVTLRMDR